MRRLVMCSFVYASLTAPAPAQQVPTCRPADATSAAMINKLKRLMEATSGRVVQQRDQAGIPRVDPATITLVTDETICSRAERAYTRALTGNSSVPSGRVYVVKVGTVYLVQDPQRRGGEFVAEVVMDGSFRVLAKWLA